MTDREAIEWLVEYLDDYYDELYTTAELTPDVANVCLSALQEREERARGCRYCSIGADMKNDEDMEMDLFNYAEGMDFSVYPNFCPMCGRPLKEE